MAKYDLTVILVYDKDDDQIDSSTTHLKSIIQSKGIDCGIIPVFLGSSKQDVRGKSLENKGKLSANITLQEAIIKANSENIIISGLEDANNFDSVFKIYDELRKGADLVLAKDIDQIHKDSLRGKIISKIEKSFINNKISNFRTITRGFSKDAFMKMEIQTKELELLSEMVIKATLINLNIKEIQVALQRNYSDITFVKSNFFLQILFLFLYSPKSLFFYPGLFLLSSGIVLNLIILFTDNVRLDIHSMLVSAIFIIIGLQLTIFFIYSRLFAWHEKLLPKNQFLDNFFKKISLEKGILFGLFLFFLGIIIGIYNFFIWQEGLFFELGIRITFKYTIQSILLIIVGINTIVSSFFMIFLLINRSGKKSRA
jgi:hypothetical protein